MSHDPLRPGTQSIKGNEERMGEGQGAKDEERRRHKELRV